MVIGFSGKDGSNIVMCFAIFVCISVLAIIIQSWYILYILSCTIPPRSWSRSKRSSHKYKWKTNDSFQLNSSICSAQDVSPSIDPGDHLFTYSFYDTRSREYLLSLRHAILSAMVLHNRGWLAPAKPWMWNKNNKFTTVPWFLYSIHSTVSWLTKTRMAELNPTKINFDSKEQPWNQHFCIVWYDLWCLLRKCSIYGALHNWYGTIMK